MEKRLKIMKRTVDAVRPAAERYVVWDSDLAGFGLRVAPSGRKTYVYKYRVGGGRAGRVRWAVIGVHGAVTPDQARITARRWAAEVAEGGDPALEKEEQRKAPTVSALLDRFLAEHVEKRSKPKTIEGYRTLIERHIRPALGRLKVVDVTRADVTRFHFSLARTPYQANRSVAVLSKAFSMAEVWGLQPDGSNPCRKVERFPEKAKERFLSATEFAALSEVLARAACGELTETDPGGEEKRVSVNLQAVEAIRLLALTGARVGEILSLRWEWINWEAGRVELPDSKTGAKFLHLPPAALALLQTLERSEGGRGFVIRGGTGDDPEKPLINIKDTWRRVRRVAGLDDVRLHDLRHSFASTAAAGGLSLPVIGALLGHKEYRTTQRYAHLADDPLRAAAAHVGGRIAVAMAGTEGGAEVAPLRRK